MYNSISVEYMIIYGESCYILMILIWSEIQEWPRILGNTWNFDSIRDSNSCNKAIHMSLNNSDIKQHFHGLLISSTFMNGQLRLTVM